MGFTHFLCKVFYTLLSPEPPPAAKLEKGDNPSWKSGENKVKTPSVKRGLERGYQMATWNQVSVGLREQKYDLFRKFFGSFSFTASKREDMDLPP